MQDKQTNRLAYPYFVSVLFQNSSRLKRRLFLIKFNLKNSLIKLTVMYNSYIFNTDAIHCERSGNGGDGTGFIYDIAENPVSFFDAAKRTGRKRVSVFSGTLKNFVNSTSVSGIHFRTCIFHELDKSVHNLGNIFAVGYADLLPHFRRG